MGSPPPPPPCINGPEGVDAGWTRFVYFAAGPAAAAEGHEKVTHTHKHISFLLCLFFSALACSFLRSPPPLLWPGPWESMVSEINLLISKRRSADSCVCARGVSSETHAHRGQGLRLINRVSRGGKVEEVVVLGSDAQACARRRTHAAYMRTCMPECVCVCV